jgi:glycosyltransferase involved in cell wall biosynthesis
MARSIRSTARFFGHVLRDVAGSLRNRWRRFQDRLSGTNDQLVIGVDVFPFTERMTGVGWYEWNLLEALARREDGLTYNLYAHTFLAPADPPAPELPDGRHLRMRAHQLPADLALPIGPTLALLRVFVEPLLRLLDHNDVLWAPNFFIPKSQMPYGRAMVATVHDLAFEAMPETVAEETLALLHRHLPETLFQSDRLIAVSDATAGDLKEYLSVNPRRIHTIHEGLEIGFVEPDSNPSNDPTLPDRYLLFVSTLEPRKNIAGVLEAFELVSGWGYDGSLVLVGKWGWHTEAIRRGMEASPVIGRILHMDYVERTQLPRLYRGWRDSVCHWSRPWRAAPR